MRSMFVIPLCLVAMCLPGVTRADSSSGPKVRIRFLGGAKKTPLVGLKVTVWPSRAKRDAPGKVAKTDRDGVAEFYLPKGTFRVGITSAKPIPYLQIPVGYKAHPFTYGRWIRVTKDDSDEKFSFELADACELVLRAVDDKTGKGIPGVVFETENIYAEQWSQAITSDAVGATRRGQSLDQPQLKTDKDGYFRCLIGPRPGYKYGVWDFPDGYKVVGKRIEVDLPTLVGKKRVEYTFRLRKKAD